MKISIKKAFCFVVGLLLAMVGVAILAQTAAKQQNVQDLQTSTHPLFFVGLLTTGAGVWLATSIFKEQTDRFQH